MKFRNHIINHGGKDMRQGRMVVKPNAVTKTQARAFSAFLHERHKSIWRRM